MLSHIRVFLLYFCCLIFLAACQPPSTSNAPEIQSPPVETKTEAIIVPSPTPVMIEPTTTQELTESTSTPIITPVKKSTEESEAQIIIEKNVLRSLKTHVEPPNVTDDEINTLVKGNLSFAFDLYPILQPKGENFFYSPYSISLAWAMLYGGARGETAQQIADVLHFSPLGERTHEVFYILEDNLLKKEKDKQGGEGFVLKIANSIWAQEGRPFLTEYIDFLAINYFTSMHVVNFFQQPEEARLIINNWVNEQTEGRIIDLFQPNSINHLTKMVLANAIYFKANWESPFDETLTKKENFFYLVGGQTSVNMMKQTATLGYARTRAYKAVELPYHGGDLSMLVMMPIDEQSNKYDIAFAEFENNFNQETIENIVNKLQPTYLNLSFPKFIIESSYRLTDTMIEMGIINAFAPLAANFSIIDGTRELYLQQMNHKTYIRVDENGTEAAAATGGAIGVTALEPNNPTVLVINHPFIFVIRDKQTGTILFIGRVFKPTFNE